MRCTNNRYILTTMLLVVSSVFCMDQAIAAILPDAYYKECIPDFSQKQDHWKNSDGAWTFCGPTSAANSLFWMSYHYNLPKLRQWLNGTQYANDFEMIDNIADVYMGFTDHGTYYDPYGGVADATFISGKRSYLDARYPWLIQKSFDAGFTNVGGKVTGVTGTPPSLEWIKNELYKCEDVEIGITYLEKIGDDYYLRGGHWMTFVGWNETQLGFHDPIQDKDTTPIWKDYDGTAFDHWAYDDYYTVGTINIAGTDFIKLDYSATRTCIIDIAVSESVPGPETVVLLGLGGLAMMRRRKQGS